MNTSAALDWADDTQVGHQSAASARVFVGAEYRRSVLSVGLQADTSDVVAYNMHIGLQL